MLRLALLLTTIFSCLAFYLPSLFSLWHRPNLPQLSFIGLAKLKYSASPPPNLGPDDLTSVPLFGDGYFAYRKIGKEIRYHSNTGEILWNKPYSQYPISDYYGQLILLLTGDSSRVDFINHDGLLAKDKSLYGSLITDHDFAARISHAAVIFSSGESYVVQADASIVFTHNFAATNQAPVFLKSCALSPNGRLLAVHLLKGDTDLLVVLGEADRNENQKQAKKQLEVHLGQVYPHLIHIAINSHGVLVTAPDQTMFFSLTGQKSWTKKNPCHRKKEKDCPIYRPVYAGEHFFTYGLGKDHQQANWTLLNRDGRQIAQGSLASNNFFTKQSNKWRFLPGKQKGTFIFDMNGRLYLYRYQDWQN